MSRWRSLLYVPAHNEKMVEGAARHGADALILDLEDSVPPAAKESARERLGESVAAPRRDGTPVLVRVNGSWSLARHDLEAAAAADASGVLVPKADSAAQVEALGEYLVELEERLELEPLALLLIIESAQGLASVQEIATVLARLPGDRTTALIPGNEDLSLSLQVEPKPEIMAAAIWPLIIAARANGHKLFGSIGSAADYRDLDALRRRLKFSRAHGFDGATCIHPSQVAVANDIYRATAEEMEWARRAVAAFESGGGEAVGMDGEMIDRPVYLRAKRLVEEDQG